MVQDTKRLLKLRKIKKRKNPSFRRVESWRFVRIKNPRWRKPIGLDSATRKKELSGVQMPTVGYRVPKKIRGIHPSGYEEVLIFTKEDINKINPKIQAIKISGKIGAKKRINLIDYAQSKHIKILNIGISKEELESLQSAASGGEASKEIEQKLEETEEKVEVKEEPEKSEDDKEKKIKKV